MLAVTGGWSHRCARLSHQPCGVGLSASRLPLSSPLERCRLPVPAACCRLHLGNDFLGRCRTLVVECPAFENALNRFSSEGGHHPRSHDCPKARLNTSDALTLFVVKALEEKMTDFEKGKHYVFTTSRIRNTTVSAANSRECLGQHEASCALTYWKPSLGPPSRMGCLLLCDSAQHRSIACRLFSIHRHRGMAHSCCDRSPSSRSVVRWRRSYHDHPSAPRCHLPTRRLLPGREDMAAPHASWVAHVHRSALYPNEAWE